jgi:hypothetical protein
MDISVVVPLYNEDESLPELTSWIAKVMRKITFLMKSCLLMMEVQIQFMVCY